MLRRLLLPTLLVGMIGTGALAQTEPPTRTPQPGPAAETPSAIVNPAVASGEAFEPEHLLGDWGGVRTLLLDKGIDVTLGYVSETAGVVAGGERTGVDYAHSIDFKLDADMQKLVGWTGFSLHSAMVERAGRDASRDFMGDYLFEVQEIYGGAGDVAVHLAYLYGEESLANGDFDIAAGRMIVGDDFASSPLYCEFMSHTDCPTLRDLGINPAFSTYPDSSWGGRVIVATPGGELKLKAGLYQVRPFFGGGGRSGWDWGGSQATGVILPVEVDWTPRIGPEHLVGHYKAGLNYDNSSYPDLGVVAGPPMQDVGRTEWYVLGDQMVMRTGPAGTNGIIVLAGYSHSSPNVSVIDKYAFVGVLADGIIPGRKDDSVGVQFMHFHVSNTLATAQAFQLESGLPLSSGLAGIPAPLGVQGDEMDLEVRYGFKIMDGFHLMPDFQYVFHPNATTRIPDAAVLGVRLTVSL
ncbi:MAG TPA: carbohydrate porin [Caulobacteraceae bacterium]|jgi:porin